LKERKKEESCIMIKDTGNNLSVTVIPSVERSLKLDKKLESARLTLGYQASYFRETFSDELWQAMDHRGLNQADFAEKASVPKQFLTKVFRGGNCTMDTIVKLAFALNYRAHIHLTPNDVACEWIHWSPNMLPHMATTSLWVCLNSRYSPVSETKKAIEVEYATIPSNS
jgi:hypothetical protein